MLEDLYPVQWTGGQAVVTLPEHIGVSNAGQVRDGLLSAINCGAMTLIVDMTATVSCDHAGADAVIRAWQRAVSSGTELRLVVTARHVSRVLELRGLDRQVSVYPSLEAAAAARLPTGAAAPRRRTGQPLDRAWAAPLLPGDLLEALPDGAVLADGDDMIVAASARLEAMFGYGPGEVPGLPAGSLVPGGLYGADGVGRAGLRKDGTTFQVRVSLTPVAAAGGQLTIAVIRDITGTARLDDLLALARDAAAAQQEHLRAQREHLRLLDAVITGLFHAGLSLQSAAGLPADAVRQRAESVLGELDDIIRQIRGAAFAENGPAPPPCPRRMSAR